MVVITVNGDGFVASNSVEIAVIVVVAIIILVVVVIVVGVW